MYPAPVTRISCTNTSRASPGRDPLTKIGPVAGFALGMRTLGGVLFSKYSRARPSRASHASTIKRHPGSTAVHGGLSALMRWTWLLFSTRIIPNQPPTALPLATAPQPASALQRPGGDALEDMPLQQRVHHDDRDHRDGD